jgi:hypothetical protein
LLALPASIGRGAVSDAMEDSANHVNWDHVNWDHVNWDHVNWD